MVKKVLNLSVIIFCIIAVTFVAVDWAQRREEQAEFEKIVHIINEDIVEKESIERLAIKEEQAKIEAARLAKSMPRLVCWGEPLMANVDENRTTSSSIVLENAGMNIVNYGIDGESSEVMAFRQGAFPIYVDGFTIPKDKTPVEIKLVNTEHQSITLFKEINIGFNPCTIAGVEGVVTVNQELNKLFFERSEIGDEVMVEANTKVSTYAMNTKKDNDILVIFNGYTNQLSMDKVDYNIGIQNAMIQYADTGRYVIIGYTSGDNSMDYANERLGEIYENHFIDIKKYLIESGLSDADIVPTEQDLVDIEKGLVPISLRVDSMTGNEYYYSLIRNQLNNKIIEQGYLTEEQIEYLGLGR